MIPNKEFDTIINGHTWRVCVVDAHDPLLVVDGISCRGACWCGHSKIALSNELGGRNWERTVKHELVHAYIYATQIDTPENFNEEQICEFIAIWGEDIEISTDRIGRKLFESKDKSEAKDLSMVRGDEIE